MEAMLCETPVVAFGATGPADIVAHLETGYLADAVEAKALAAGIDWVLNQDDAGLGIAGRERALRHFSPSVVAAQYSALYEQLLGATQPS